MRTALTILFIMVCIALCVVVLMQKGRDSGISGLTGGSSDTYWDKNNGRSREGRILLITRVLSVLAILLAAVLNITVF